MRKHRNIILLALAITLVLITIATALTPYRRVTPLPQKLDAVIDLALEIAEERKAEIAEDIAYADALVTTGRTHIELRNGLYIPIAEWKTEAEAKLAALNEKIAPLQAQ